MVVVRLSATGVNIVQVCQPILYYYTLDLLTGTPGWCLEELVRQAALMTSPFVDTHRNKDLHSTMMFKHTSGPDNCYEEKFMNAKTKNSGGEKFHMGL